MHESCIFLDRLFHPVGDHSRPNRSLPFISQTLLSSSTICSGQGRWICVGCGSRPMTSVPVLPPPPQLSGTPEPPVYVVGPVTQLVTPKFLFISHLTHSMPHSHTLQPPASCLNAADFEMANAECIRPYSPTVGIQTSPFFCAWVFNAANAVNCNMSTS